MENLEKAIELTERCFENKVRKNGEPYVQHCHNVVNILKKHGLEDEKLLVSAMLHEVCKDTDKYTDDIQTLFGERVCFIVDKLLAKNQKPKAEHFKETFKPDDTYKTLEEYLDYRLLMHANRFYMGVIADPYSVFIKMADQIDNLETIEIFSNEKMAEKIEEIKKYFIPVYKKILLRDILSKRYEELYIKLQSHLTKILKEKEEILDKRLQEQKP